MASISALGVGSGLDLSGLLDQLNSAERLKLQPINKQKSVNQSKISAFGRLQSALTSFQTAVEKLNQAKTFQAQTSKISGSGVAVASTASAVAGSYQIEVGSLAQAQSQATGGVSSQTSKLGEGTLTLRVGSASPFDIALNDSNNSLTGIRDAINAQKKGVTASIINDGSGLPYRLVLTSDKTGTDSTVSVQFGSDPDKGGALTGLFGAYNEVGNPTGIRQTVAASNAQLTVNGVAIISQSNTVEGALQGVTLTVSATGGPQTLTIERDVDSIKSAITGFVDAYNSLAGTMASLTSYNAETKVAGDLLGDSTLRSVQSRLRSLMTSAVEGDGYTLLSQVGVSLQVDGKFKVDNDKLDKAVRDDVSAVSSFFAGSSLDAGYAGRLRGALQDMLSVDGILSKASEGLKARNVALDKTYERMESIISSTIERYRVQFGQLDSLISQMNATSSYVTQQFTALNAQSRG